MKTKNNKADRAAIPFPDEITHLKGINRMLDDAVKDASANVERKEKEYSDMKRYMAEYRGETDPHEMFQNQLSLRQMDDLGVFAVEAWNKLAKCKDFRLMLQLLVALVFCFFLFLL